MELKIDNPTQEKQFISKICFKENAVVLQGQTPVVLSYSETDFRLVIHLRVGTSFCAEKSQNKINYIPQVHFLTFEFTSNNFTYQVNHVGTLKLCFELLDQKYPFKQFSFGFENHQNDPLTVKLAQRITTAFNDHLKYGLHENILYPRAQSLGTTPHRVYYYWEDNPFHPIIGTVLVSGILLLGTIFPLWLLYYLYIHREFDVVWWGFAIFVVLILSFIVFYLQQAIKALKTHRKLQQLKKNTN